jgi:integrase
MSGWLETLPSKRVRAVYRDVDGHRHSQTFPTRREAKAFLAATVTDLDRGHWIDPRGGQIPFADWAQRWSAARLIRVSTAASENGRMRNHLLPYFGTMALKDITPLTVRGFVAQLSTKVAPKTVRNVHALLSTVLRDAVLEGLLLSNPCAGIRLPKEPRSEAVFLSPAQIDALVQATPPAYRTLILTAAGTGMRWGELAGLHRSRLDLLRRRIEVAQTLVDVGGELSFGEPKTAQSRRYVSLPPTLVTALAAHLQDHASELVFTNEQGTPLRRSNFHARVWRPATAAAGFTPAPRFHDLRHSHVAMLIAAGTPMKAIQHRLGHASIVMTMDRYGHLLEDVDEDLIAGLEKQLGGL